MDNRRKVALGTGIGAMIVGGVLLLKKKEPPPQECLVDSDCPEGYTCVNGVCVPVTPPFRGFSLAVINSPEGTHFWRPSMFTNLWLTTSQSYFHYDYAPGLVEMMIDCRTFEGEGAGPGEIWCSCDLRDGHNYILNLVTCELSENPSPPSWPSPNKPRLISHQIPAIVTSGKPFQASASWYLPMPWITSAGQVVEYPYYTSLELALEGTGNYAFLMEAQSIVCNPWGERTIYITQSGEYTGSYQQVISNVAPGRYKIIALVRAGKHYGCDADNDPQVGPPQETYDLGIVGQVEIL